MSGAVSKTGPELVFGIVKPVGTPDGAFHAELKSALQRYEYRIEPIKLSDLLRDRMAARGEAFADGHEEERVAALMDEGDRLCNEHDARAAVAILGVAEVRTRRAHHHGMAPDTAADIPAPRTAFVLDSLKRPEEITQLRRIYGDHFIVISLQADVADRRDNLRAKIGNERPSLEGSELDATVQRLIDRDLAESHAYGQNTLRAFPMADVFIASGPGVGSDVRRVIDLLFDSPEPIPPTEDEYAMRVAAVTSTRSPELGRQVGAAVVDADGRVAGVGFNAHPDPDTAPEVDSSQSDIIRLVTDTLSHLAPHALTDEVIHRLHADADGYARELLRGPLATARIRDLIEFQIPVHAELNALLDALQSGSTLRGARVFLTTFPCHHCAKHLVKLDLDVRFLEPYPKSRAAAMYGAVVQRFQPFTGVAPRRYEQLFTPTRDRKDTRGFRRQWGDAERAGAAPKVDPFVDPGGISVREVIALEFLASRGPVPAPHENLSHPPDTVTTAGNDPDEPTARTPARRRAKSASPTSPARRKPRNGGVK